MGKAISDEIIKQIPILYDKYGVKKLVAEELNISVGSVSKYLTLYTSSEKDNEKKSKPRVKITEELIKQINELYKKYKNMSQVAKELNISATTVKKYLSEENLKLKEKINDDRDALWFYIFRLFGQHSEDKPVSDWNITQMQKFKKQGISYKAQLLCLKYFYEVKKNTTTKSNGSIGIIPFIFEESKMYYENQARKIDEINAAIQKQLEQDRIEIKYNPSDYIGVKKKKKIINLNELMSE